MNKPLKEYVITQPYGKKNAAYSKGYHTGIDLAARGMDKSIYSVSSGKVIRARFSGGKGGADPTGWGNYVIIRSGEYDIIYAHLASVSVTQGMTVSTGDRIGIQGSTGNSTGPHLHFEVRHGEWTLKRDIDPMEYLETLFQDASIPIRLFCRCGEVLDVLYGTMIDGTIHAPVRPLMEQCGYKVNWDKEKVDITP